MRLNDSDQRINQKTMTTQEIVDSVVKTSLQLKPRISQRTRPADINPLRRVHTQAGMDV
jgi:hypothetical protein